jgi:hypothetical protein
MERISVIKEILTLVRDGGLSKNDIADRIGIQPTMLDTVFSFLSVKGYMQKIDSTIAEPFEAYLCCSGCTRCTSRTCATTAYVITEKGKTYLHAK